MIDAVELIAADGYRLLPDYRFDPRTGLWRHASGPPRPPLQLAEVSYGPDGEITYPRRRAQAGEDAFPGYLNQARALLATHPGHIGDGPTGLSPQFEARLSRGIGAGPRTSLLIYPYGYLGRIMIPNGCAWRTRRKVRPGPGGEEARDEYSGFPRRERMRA